MRKIKKVKKPKKKIVRKIKIIKKQYREVYANSPLEELNNTKRYRYTYDDIDRFPDERVEYIERNGFPEEKDAARSILAKRKMKHLVTYGY